MKKVLAITLMLLLCATAAMCAENNWRIQIKGDNGYGLSGTTGGQAGVYPTGQEGLDSTDGTPYAGFQSDPGTAMHCVFLVPGVANNAYGRTIKAATSPVPEKTWDFLIAGSTAYGYETMRVRVQTVASTAQIATPTFNGEPVKYAIRMVNNRGIVGAPANGTMWELPAPPTTGNTVYWDSPILPIVRITDKSNAGMIAAAYQMQLVQMPVPEPSSLLALGTGLVGLVGLVSRRRRA